MSLLDSLHAKTYDCLTAPMERRGMAEQRRQMLAGLEGDVLEVGAGTGRNLEFYPSTVRLTLTEPSAPMMAKLADHVRRTRPEATVLQAPAERLPFDDASFDAVVTTLVLCSVDDPETAVRELRRVLRAGGTLVAVEHVATEGGPSLPQRLWEPAQKVVGRNCHMTRDSRAALERGGFDTSGLVDTTMPGAPAWLFPLIMGIAVPKDSGP